MALSFSLRLLVANTFIISTMQYVMAFCPTPQYTITALCKRVILFVCQMFMISFDLLCNLRAFGFSNEVWDFHDRNIAIMLRTAFATSHLSPRPYSLLNGGVLVNINGSIPRLSLLWSRAHSIFYARTRRTVHSVVNDLTTRALKFTRDNAKARAGALKKLQRTLLELLRPSATFLNAYIKRRISRYDDAGDHSVSNRFFIISRISPTVCVEERDRVATLRFFFNGWFSLRRFQGRSKASGTGRCHFCGRFSCDKSVVPAYVHLDEDSNDHARHCHILTLAAISLGLIRRQAVSWWDEWCADRFGRVRHSADHPSAPVQPSEAQRTFDFISWLGALYTLHNHARHCINTTPWGDAQILFGMIFHIMDDIGGRKRKTRVSYAKGLRVGGKPEEATSSGPVRRPRMVPPRSAASTGVT